MLAVIVSTCCLLCPCAGLVVFGTLNLSSPLLHMSKLASALELKTAKTLLFALFAAVFFVTRVLLFPYFILKWCVRGLQDSSSSRPQQGRCSVCCD
jgi:hypothetical protein